MLTGLFFFQNERTLGRVPKEDWWRVVHHHHHHHHHLWARCRSCDI